MSEDKTVELVMNLNRAAVEDILRKVVTEAKSRQLEDIPMLLGNFIGMSQGELRKRVELCLQSLSESPEHKALYAQLELVELNLHNLH